MVAKLILLFVGLPFLEMVILIKLGAEIGFGPTLLIVIGTGVLGAALARSQGLSIWLQIQQELQMGRMPAEQLVDGLLILVGGIVLLTPGLITDFLGLLLLIPVTRNLFKLWLWRKFDEMVQGGQSDITFFIR